MSCIWTPIATPPTSLDFVERTRTSTKPAIEVQRSNGRRRYVSLDLGNNFTLPSGTVAWRPACPDYVAPVINNDLFRYLVIEDGTTVLTNYDYSTRSAAEGYVAAFGGERDLEVVYSAEAANPGDSLTVYAVVETDPITSEESILEIKTTQLAANSYVSVFGGSKTLRITALVVVDEAA